MTREEAIRIATGLRTDFKCESDTMVDFCNTVIKALEQEPCEDCISRRAVMDILENAQIITDGEFCGYCTEDININIRNLPSVNPQPCEDAISRKALISHIENQSREWGEDYDAQQILGDIEDMPSVKQDCDNCEVGNPCLYCKHEFEPQERSEE